MMQLPGSMNWEIHSAYDLQGTSLTLLVSQGGEDDSASELILISFPRGGGVGRGKE